MSAKFLRRIIKMINWSISLPKSLIVLLSAQPKISVFGRVKKRSLRNKLKRKGTKMALQLLQCPRTAVLIGFSSPSSFREITIHEA